MVINSLSQWERAGVRVNARDYLSPHPNLLSRWGEGIFSHNLLYVGYSNVPVTG